MKFSDARFSQEKRQWKCTVIVKGPGHKTVTATLWGSGPKCCFKLDAVSEKALNDAEYRNFKQALEQYAKKNVPPRPSAVKKTIFRGCSKLAKMRQRQGCFSALGVIEKDIPEKTDTEEEDQDDPEPEVELEEFGQIS